MLKDELKLILSPYIKRKNLERVVQSVYDQILNFYKEETLKKISAFTDEQIRKMGYTKK